MTTTAAPGQAPAHPPGPRWRVPLLVLVGVVLGAALTWAVLAIRTDDASGGSSTARLSQVQASCGDWMTSYRGEAPPDDRWCTDMFTWMGDRSDGSMMGSMIWRGPVEMGDACRQWVDEGGVGTGSSGRQRCDDMVEWMDGHLSSRGGSWMMQDR